jgi:hypothetical protein
MRRLVLLGLLALTLAAGAQSANAYRSVPVGIYNVNNQVMNSSKYVYSVRFVLDRDTTMYRFISGFNLEGSDPLGGRTGYADGTGGKIRARLVAVKSNGQPDMSQVLAEETVGAWQRYTESKSAYNAPGLTQLLYFNMGGVQLRAGQMYAMTYQNVDSSPGSNWFSENSPTVKESVAGPNGVNTTDPNAPGAIAGLDPREAVAWSTDGGQSWVWGRHAGEGNTPGAYGGSATDDDGTRLPWYGWQSSAGASPESNQPYYAYRESGSYTLRVSASSQSVTLDQAGAYAPVGASAGVLTVRNLSTGAVGRTAWLGSGLVRGALDKPVPVQAGQSYEISNSGEVMKAEGDSFIQSTFKIGTGTWSYSTAGNGSDMAQVFAEPSSSPVAESSSSEVVFRKAIVADRDRPGHRGAERRPVVRLIMVGRATGRFVRPGSRVRLQLRYGGGWHQVGHTRLRKNGRFRLVRRGRLSGPIGKSLHARAIVRGVGRSRTVHVALHR